MDGTLYIGLEVYGWHIRLNNQSTMIKTSIWDKSDEGGLLISRALKFFPTMKRDVLLIVYVLWR
jgi:hypothetical protein